MKSIKLNLIVVFSVLCIVFSGQKLLSDPCDVWVNNAYDANYQFQPLPDGTILVWGVDAFNNLTDAIISLNSNCKSINKKITIEGQGLVQYPVAVDCPNINLYIVGPVDVYFGIQGGPNVTLKLLSLNINTSCSLSGAGEIECENVDFISGKVEINNINMKVSNSISNYNKDKYFVTNGTGSVFVENQSLVTAPVGIKNNFAPVDIDSDPGNIFAVQSEPQPIWPDTTTPGSRKNLGLLWNIEHVFSSNPTPISSTISFTYPKALFYSNSLNSITINNVVVWYKTASGPWVECPNFVSTVVSPDNNYWISTIIEDAQGFSNKYTIAPSSVVAAQVLEKDIILTTVEFTLLMLGAALLGIIIAVFYIRMRNKRI